MIACHWQWLLYIWLLFSFHSSFISFLPSFLHPFFYFDYLSSFLLFYFLLCFFLPSFRFSFFFPFFSLFFFSFSLHSSISFRCDLVFFPSMLPFFLHIFFLSFLHSFILLSLYVILFPSAFNTFLFLPHFLPSFFHFCSSFRIYSFLSNSFSIFFLWEFPCIVVANVMYFDIVGKRVRTPVAILYSVSDKYP